LLFFLCFPNLRWSPESPEAGLSAVSEAGCPGGNLDPGVASDVTHGPVAGGCGWMGVNTCSEPTAADAAAGGALTGTFACPLTLLLLDAEAVAADGVADITDSGLDILDAAAEGLGVGVRGMDVEEATTFCGEAKSPSAVTVEDNPAAGRTEALGPGGMGTLPVNGATSDSSASFLTGISGLESSSKLLSPLLLPLPLPPPDE